jgi:hypothetical protein
MNNDVMVTCAQLAVEPRDAKFPHHCWGFGHSQITAVSKIARRVTSWLRTPSRARALPGVHQRCFTTPDVTAVAVGTRCFIHPVLTSQNG